MGIWVVSAMETLIHEKMNEFKNVEKDYKKWILFNNLLADFQNLYELYTCVDSKVNKGGVSFHVEPGEGGTRFIIEQNGNASTLELTGEADRQRFLEYLVQFYFPNQEIEDWYKSKTEAKEKTLNHSTSELTSKKQSQKTFEKFKPHPKESKYYRVRVAVSILFYLSVLVFLVLAFIQSTSDGISATLMIAAIVLFFAGLQRLTQGLFIGRIKGNAIKIDEQQYPEIFKIAKNQAEQIGLKEMPEVYISAGNFNAFVTKLARRKYLMLYSEVIETASRGDFEVLKFVIGHELGHLKRRHLSLDTWLIPSSFVPFLKQAHSRGSEYTCDRIGYHFSSQGSVEGILILATGKEIHSKINIKRYIEDAGSEKGFWVWLSEKFQSHPHLSHRMMNIKTYSQRV